jgi:protein associated with RNAse G/E
MSKSLVTINSRKFDGKIHRSWKAELLSRTDEILTFVGEFEKEVKHPFLGVIRRGTISYEFYWEKLWFNVFRFHEPEGGLRNFYCNVNQPPQFKNGVLDYIDLDIDVLVWKDYSYQILDLDEFERNAERFKYSLELRGKADAALKELLLMLEHKSFPFDYKF